MYGRRRLDRAPGRSCSARLLSWAGETAGWRGLWAHAKVHFAIKGLILSVAVLAAGVAQIAAHAGNQAAWALLAGAGAAGLLTWIRFIAIPLATRGKLPDGRNVAEVLGRRRMLRQLAEDRRQALRQWRDRPRYQGPHSHRRPRSLPPPNAKAPNARSRGAGSQHSEEQ